MSEPEIKPRVVALVRVSTVGQAGDDRMGIERQMDSIGRNIQAHDLDCIETFKLEGVSGTTMHRHPVVLKINEMLKAGEITGLVVSSMDRLLRQDTFDSGSILDAFVECRASIYTDQSVLNLGKPEGRFVARITMATGGFDRETMLDRLFHSIRLKKMKGGHPFGDHQLPRGIVFDRKTEKFGVDSVAIAPVLEAYRLIDEEGVTVITEVARRVGIPHTTLRKQLRNTLYKGVQRHDTQRSKQTVISRNGKPYHPKEPCPPDKIIEVKVLDPPPVDPGRWERVELRLQQKSKKWRATHSKNVAANLLRGIAVCSSCGSRLYAHHDCRKPKYSKLFCGQNYYKNGSKKSRCGCGAPRMSLVDAESTVLEFASEQLRNPEFVEVLVRYSLSTHQATLQTPPSNVDTKSFDKRRENLAQLFELGSIELELYQKRLSKIKKEEDASKAMAEARITADQDIQQQASILTQRLVKAAYAFQRVTSRTTQREILSGFFESISMYDGSIIEFKLRRELFQPTTGKDFLPALAAGILTTPRAGA